MKKENNPWENFRATASRQRLANPGDGQDGKIADILSKAYKEIGEALGIAPQDLTIETFVKHYRNYSQRFLSTEEGIIAYKRRKND